METLSLKIGVLPLLIGFLVPAILYLVFIPKLPFAGDFVLKSLPIFLLAFISLTMVPGWTGKLLCLGFILSAGGDISLSFEGDKFFIMGLSFFLLAHVVYVIVFSRQFEFSLNRLPIALVLAAFAIGMSVKLFPGLGDLKVPVLIYISVILAMGVTATFWQGERNWLLLAGAVIFMLSDSMIAINKFLMPVSWSKYFIMSTYYAGQVMICVSFLPKKVF